MEEKELTENVFHQRLVKGLKYNGLWAHKISDASRAVTKPFDLVTCWSGIFVGIECKQTKIDRSMTPLPKLNDVVAKLTELRPSQVKNLTELGQSGGTPMVALSLYPIYAPNSERAWILDYDLFCSKERWTVHDLAKGCVEYLNQGSEAYCTELTWIPCVGWALYSKEEKKDALEDPTDERPVEVAIAANP